MTKRKCLTPGAFYHFKTDEWSRSLDFSVLIGDDMFYSLTESRLKLLEKAFHDAIEKTLAPVWKVKKK